MTDRTRVAELGKDRRKNYRLFISHSWEYTDEYSRMVELLNDASYFSWRNYSVPQEKEIDTSTDDELWDALRNQIKPSSVVIVLAGMYTAHSKWIRREMIIAKIRGKPIIGVKPWGNAHTPKKVREDADIMVGWNTSSVVDAVRNLSP